MGTTAVTITDTTSEERSFIIGGGCAVRWYRFDLCALCSQGFSGKSGAVVLRSDAQFGTK